MMMCSAGRERLGNRFLGEVFFNFKVSSFLHSSTSLKDRVASRFKKLSLSRFPSF